MVYKYSLNEKPIAVKLIKQQIIKRKVLKMVHEVKKFQHRNLVQLASYCLRPSALIFE